MSKILIQCMVFVAIVVAALAVPTRAQSSVPIATRYYENGWTFVPQLGSSKVESFLAWADSGLLTGSNIGIIWFVPMGGSEWSAWSWPTNDLGVAVKSIRAIPGFETAFLCESDLNVKASCAPEPVDPKALENGLFVDDPLQSTLTVLTEPGTFVAQLAAAGWTAVPGLSPTLGNTTPFCNPTVRPIDEFMQAMAVSAEKAAFGTATSIAPCSNPDGSWPCGCTTSYTGVTATAPATWRIRRATSATGFVYCEYCRPATATKAFSGDRLIICTSCPASVAVTGYEYGTCVPLDQETCPTSPCDGTAFHEGTPPF